jgi:hypothetical protein
MGPRINHYNACFTLWQGESMKEVRKVFMEGFIGLAENGDTYAMYTYVFSSFLGRGAYQKCVKA